MSVLGLIMSISPYLRSAMVRFPLLLDQHIRALLFMSQLLPTFGLWPPGEKSPELITKSLPEGGGVQHGAKYNT